MIVPDWNKLSANMQTKTIAPYYEYLNSKKVSLILKRIFDVIFALLLLIILSPIFLILSIAIKIDSPGPVFFRQVRVTQYGKEFRIFKFRTMVIDAEKKGTQITAEQDSRITKIGNLIRKTRLDEIPQLINVLFGTMTFVGTRPEVPKYVEQYSDEMLATLLLPAGVTSEASVFFKDEAKIIGNSRNIEKTYIEEVLPRKMEYNIQYLKKFNIWNDLRIIFFTVFNLLKKD